MLGTCVVCVVCDVFFSKKKKFFPPKNYFLSYFLTVLGHAGLLAGGMRDEVEVGHHHNTPLVDLDEVGAWDHHIHLHLHDVLHVHLHQYT